MSHFLSKIMVVHINPNNKGLNVKNIIFSSTLLILFTTLTFAGVKVDVQLSPAGSFEIDTGSISGKIEKTSSGYRAKKLSVSVRNFTTSMELRDKHTKEKLQVSEYPKITVFDVVAASGKGSAMIKIMNIKKPISFTYKESDNKITANFELKLSDFNIKGINYMSVGVKDTVKIMANLNL